MSDTPRTDAEYDRLKSIYDDWARREKPCCAFDNDMRLARQLERELAKAEERNRFLVDSYAKAHEEICQTAGKALGYPWLKDDQKNFLGATEEDGVCVGEHVAETIVEELAMKYTEARDRIKRLEESGDRVAAAWDKEWLNQADIEAIIDDWHKAKEIKP